MTPLERYREARNLLKTLNIPVYYRDRYYSGIVSIKIGLSMGNLPHNVALLADRVSETKRGAFSGCVRLTFRGIPPNPPRK